MNQKRANITLILVFINVAVFFWIQSLARFGGGSNALEQFITTWGLVPANFLAGSFWQPITTMFVHYDPMHLFVNMLALWSLGTPIERTLGAKKFAWLYFVSGATGSLFVITWASVMQDDTLVKATVGASGGVLGILGALSVFYPNSLLLVFFIPMKARTAVIGFAVISVVLSIWNVLPFISHMGHLGGLVGGVLYSRFALGINFFQNDLHQTHHPFQRFRGGGPGGASPGDPLEELLRRLQNMDHTSYTGSSQGGGAQPGPGPSEKVINPFPEDFIKSDGSESENGVPEKENRDGDEGGKRLYYDPATGRFYLK